MIYKHIIKWFQELLYNNHDITSVICLHTVCSIWLRDRTLLGATVLGQSRLGSNGNKKVLHIPQISKAGAPLSDCFISYPGHSLEGVLPFGRNAVGVFYSSSQLDYSYLDINDLFIYDLKSSGTHDQSLKFILNFENQFQSSSSSSSPILSNCSKNMNSLDWLSFTSRPH